MYPFVSVIIPVRNEENHIEKCIDSLMNTDFPMDKAEFIIADGMSSDKTAEKVEKLSEKYGNIVILSNEKKKKSFALNIGIKNSHGEIIIVADAHSSYSRDYIKNNVDNLLKSNADNVGGTVFIRERNSSVKAKSIADVLSHPFGTGGASYRNTLSEPKEVDTVPFGCFKREVFEKIGYFNENLDRNMDIEFNLRMKKNGCKIMLFPNTYIEYYARDTFFSLWKNNFGNGLWVIKSSKYSEKAFSLRHLIPLFFVLFLIFGTVFSLFFKPVLYGFMFILGFYTALNILFSFRLALRRKCFLCFFLNIIGFAVLHMSYGFGSLFSLINYFK